MKLVLICKVILDINLWRGVRMGYGFCIGYVTTFRSILIDIESSII